MLRFVLFGLLWSVHGQGTMYEGDTCVANGFAGVCTNVRRCPSAVNDIRNMIKPEICSYDKKDPIVCCVDRSGTTLAAPVATTTKRAPTTTEYVPPVYDYVSNNDGSKVGNCRPIPPDQTSPKTGQKAWDKCVDYQEQLIYPCEKGVALTGTMSRGYHCKHNADELIVGGTAAAANEFPHMALLGYGQESNIVWQCGGALISENFVLTAGHCASSRDEGPVSFVYIGAMRRSDVTDVSKRYRVQSFIKHPEYKPPSKYNDIALIKTDRPVPLNEFTVPACLHVGDPVNDTRASATGWGLTEYRGSTSETLQKVILTKFTLDECSKTYPAHRHMRMGVDESTQMCFGDRNLSKDTCQGDSGGPLQIKSKKIDCMYILVGVTSFGAACGFAGVPGVYTIVAPYVSWIESVVWP